MLQFLDERQPESTTVEYVGGPRDGQRETLDEQPAAIAVAEGTYVRSVRCADDEALRYVWAPSEA